MTAPDRITLYPYDRYESIDDDDPKEFWDSDPEEMLESSGTKYIRSDLHAALQAENERLRDVLQRIEAASKFWSKYHDGNDAIRYAHDSTHRLARAALK